jgi:hypothetical protein
LHSAVSAKDCISVLSESASDVVDVYNVLCDYTHPAEASLFRFAGERTPPDTLTFDPNAGPRRLAEIVALSERVGKVALVLAIAPLVTTLKTLNAFAFAPVATPWADGVDLSFSDVWRDLNKRLRSQVGPKTASGEERATLFADLDAQYRPFGTSKRRKGR